MGKRQKESEKMTTRKPHLTPEEAKAFAVRVKEALDNGATLWVSIPHTSRTNMSYTINARLIGGALNSDEWLNYWLGAEWGWGLDDRDNLKQTGCGTDRAFQLACDIAHILRKYGLAENRFEYDIKRRLF